MSVGRLLERLDQVRSTGHGRWSGRCPAHDDKRPSLSIREFETGVVGVHCFAGCAVEDVLTAVGLTFEALFPERTPRDHRRRPYRPGFPAADVLRCIAFEATVVAVAAARLAGGEPMPKEDRTRLLLAASRLNVAVSESGHD